MIQAWRGGRSGRRALAFLSSYTVCGDAQRRFIISGASSGTPLDPGQDVTHGCQAVSLEAGIIQHCAAIPQVLYQGHLVFV